MRYLIPGIGLLFVSGGIFASEVAPLLGAVPGEVSTFHGRSVGGPFDILRIPTGNSQLASIYPDLEVMISRESRKIVGVGSRRAYFTEAGCERAQAEVRNLLTEAFPSKYIGRDPRWQYQSSDGGITAGAICSNANPYPTLSLDVTHTETNNEILRHFE